MKNVFITIVTIIIILLNLKTSFGQFVFEGNNIDIKGKYIDDAEKMNLKDNVKEVVEYYFDVEVEEDVIKKGKMWTKFIGKKYVFDESGNLLEDFSFRDSTDITIASKNYRNEFKFDENGRVILKLKYDEEDMLKKQYEYKYDKFGRLIAYNIYKANGDEYGKTSFKYDKKTGYINTRITKDSYTYKYTYKYNKLENGNLECHEYYGKTKEETAVYNKDGQILDQMEHSRITLGIPVGGDSEKFEFDENGNETYKISLTKEIMGYNEKTIKFSYKYDDQSNWIEKIKYTVDKTLFKKTEGGGLKYIGDKPVEFYTREIKYFE
jgi:hypothetical protein